MHCVTHKYLLSNIHVFRIPMHIPFWFLGIIVWPNLKFCGQTYFKINFSVINIIGTHFFIQLIKWSMLNSHKIDIVYPLKSDSPAIILRWQWQERIQNLKSKGHPVLYRVSIGQWVLHKVLVRANEATSISCCILKILKGKYEVFKFRLWWYLFSWFYWKSKNKYLQF